MSVIAAPRPRPPLRLAGVLAVSLLFFSTVAGALFAALWVARDIRATHESAVAGTVVEPTQGDFNLPPGVIAVHRVADAAEFASYAGFAPFVPDAIPDSADASSLSYAVAFPDASGVRAGRIAYSAKDGAAVDGISGPLVVLAEARARPGASYDGELKRLTAGTGRALAATLRCGDLVIDVQLYFTPAPAEGEPYLTPYMTSVAERFLDGVTRQCAG